jgi:uncharacterized membrane protein (GlpM family)
LAQLILKGLAGGTFVVAFALLGSVVKPKRLAGLFSAAPSVAIASLLIAAYSRLAFPRPIRTLDR